MDKQIVSLDELMARIKANVQPDFDRVVAIGRGGILPGYLCSRFLDIPLDILPIEFRDDNHERRFEQPQVISDLPFNPAGLRILLTDDVANSGKTLKTAIKTLPGASVTTLVMSGNGDISLFGPHERCIEWPWD